MVQTTAEVVRLMPPDRSRGELILGRVKATPDGDADGLMVIVDTFDGRRDWGPYPWRPRGDDNPNRGDDALLARLGPRVFLVDWYPREVAP